MGGWHHTHLIVPSVSSTSMHKTQVFITEYHILYGVIVLTQMGKQLLNYVTQLYVVSHTCYKTVTRDTDDWEQVCNDTVYGKALMIYNRLFMPCLCVKKNTRCNAYNFMFVSHTMSLIVTYNTTAHINILFEKSNTLNTIYGLVVVTFICGNFCCLGYISLVVVNMQLMAFCVIMVPLSESVGNRIWFIACFAQPCVTENIYQIMTLVEANMQ